MANGVDFTDKTLTGKELKAAGKAFACRYLPYPGGAWKALSLAEAKEKSAHGIRIVSNWETNGKPANTFATGQSHARQAEAAHRSCGGPATAPIYFSIDSDVPVDSKDAYASGLKSVLGADRVGVYGSSGLVRHWLSKGYAKFGWRSMSTGWRGGSSTAGCSLKQTGGGHVAGTSVDFDTSLVSNYGGWLIGQPTPTPIPTPLPEDEVTKEDIAAIAEAVVAQKLGRSGPTVGVALQTQIAKDATAQVLQSPQFKQLLADVAAIKAKP